MQSWNLRDEECFDREVWRKKVDVFGFRKTCVYTEQLL
jgi:hypothetical protein